MSASVDNEKMVDVQIVAEKLTHLPKEALIYIAGYVEGCRDRPKDDDKAS